MSKDYNHKVYLGLGCNLGDRLGSLNQALVKLSGFGELAAVSRIYESAAWGYEDEHRYLNLVCCFYTSLDPLNLHRETLKIERELGREGNKRKEGEAYRSRLIDIDILFFDKLVMRRPELTIPHPQIQLRNFVLKPMADIAQDLVHPVLNRSIRELYFSSPDTSAIEVID
ncbi:MAG: 2-amino-4-hydroxy-6-hydroxymethyldihydropteridine diphosphokinase [Flavobacteriales bacterium]|nr:2-amino-4-hydroxy-6-hydroxymethyldihydropteridine diphosphokinase [Flavobacteriales bacterium]